MKRSVLFWVTVLSFFGSVAQTTAKEWFDKGASLVKNQKYTEAIAAFKNSIKIQPGYAEALHQLGWCYNEEGLYKEAIEALKKEEKTGSPDKVLNNFELGYAYKGLQEYDDALLYFNKAIEGDANYALAYKERGNTWQKKKEYEKAIADYNRYAELSTTIDDDDYYYNKGWCENELNRFSAASESLKKCVELNKNNTSGFTELGYSYYKLNLNNEAIANYRIAMRLANETNYVPILGIADVYYDNLKNFDSAIVYYEKGTQLQKKNKSAYYRLGWCYNDKGKYTEAVSPLQQAVLLDADYDDARTELGYAYYKLDQYDNALSQFRPIMTRNPKNELSRYYAGFCYYLKGEQDNLKKMIAELKALNSSKYVETLTKYVK
ncbi:MAG: tetratricopeptide repeat protein [Bacteroidota bacterium]|nr:tetratricopeptide repeat protein [Bacteroidota bacterium]